jgi:predicted nucleic acid-binding protein
MKNIFLDTNIVIDFLADRKPFSLSAAKLLNHAVKGKIVIYISAVSYNNIYYALNQRLTNKETIKLLDDISEMTEITDVTATIIKKSLKTDFKDFEDAIQYNCAISNSKIESIITRNTKDFKKSLLPVLTPAEALSIIESKS